MKMWCPTPEANHVRGKEVCIVYVQKNTEFIHKKMRWKNKTKKTQQNQTNNKNTKVISIHVFIKAYIK